MSPFRPCLLVVVVAACAFGASVPAGELKTRMGFWPEQNKAELPGVIAPHIVGGNNAAPGEFPHQVSMQVVILWLFRQHICGGTILSPEWILTAAHCVKGVPFFASVEVLAGKHDLSKTEPSEQRVKVAQMYSHEKFGGGVGPYDVGLLRLKSPLTFTDRVKPARLPQPNSIPQGAAILSGWGSISSSRIPTLPDILQTANLPLIEYSKCYAAIDQEADGEENPLRDTNVCTGPLGVQGLSACNGDSGGPLVQLNEGEATVIGIVSWGFFPCGAKGSPSVYTRVSAYNDWINNKIEKS